MMARLIALLIAGILLLSAPAGSGIAQPAAATSTTPDESAPPEIDDIAATERGVVRVVVVAIVNGEVVGFGHGSGFAITPTRIVTNAHVVEDAAQYPENVAIGVVPSEGSRSYSARLISVDRKRDLAIIEMAQGRVPPISLFSGAVAGRQSVFALGYPGNVDLATAQNMDAFIHPRAPIASDGIVSATDQINGISALIHDADIARGNSGGPLVDACGRVVGVNTFISRADDGDSPFSFAITVRELMTFLRDANQDFTATATACVSASQAAARDAARQSAEQQAAMAREERAVEQRIAAQEAQLQRLRARAFDRHDNFLALSFVLFGIAILCGAAAFMYQVQNRMRERRAAVLGGSLLAAGSVILFLLKPNPNEVTLDTTATATPTASPDPATNGAPNTADGATPAARTSAPLYGALSCIVDRDRGRITVSAGDDPRLTITPTGCVNGRTQYVRDSDGSWTRTLVPQQDATITHIRYDPVRRESTVRRYLMSLEAMEDIRRQRQASASPTCTQDAAALDALAARERAIAAMLPRQPHEEIVSRCSVSAESPAPRAAPRTAP